MVARARKENESFKDYRKSLKHEAERLKSWLWGNLNWGINNGSNKGWRNNLKRKLKKEKIK
jgi:hypothetical protein